jgi:hypothetical protein
MELLHQELDLNPADVVEVTLDHGANVQLLDADNYERYRRGELYHYHGGGYVTQSPFHFRAPRAGSWHLVIDLGGNAGRVRAWPRVLQENEAVAG